MTENARGWNETTQNIVNSIHNNVVEHLSRDVFRFVTTPNSDWAVLYLNDNKIWEDDSWNTNMVDSIAESLNIDCYHYEFTDEDEVDGFTPDKFSDIIGIEEWK